MSAKTQEMIAEELETLLLDALDIEEEEEEEELDDDDEFDPEEDEDRGDEVDPDLPDDDDDLEIESDDDGDFLFGCWSVFTRSIWRFWFFRLLRFFRFD